MADIDTTNFVDRIVNFFVIHEGKYTAPRINHEQEMKIGEGQCHKLVLVSDKSFRLSATHSMSKQFSRQTIAKSDAVLNQLNFQTNGPNPGSCPTAPARC